MAKYVEPFPKYTKTHSTMTGSWTTGEIITEELLNQMENQLKQNTEGFSDLISYSESQPTSAYNQLWLEKKNSPTQIRIAQAEDVEQIQQGFKHIVEYTENETTLPKSQYNVIWMYGKDQLSLAEEEEIVNIKDMISDEYSANKSYNVGDYCIYNNILYKCIKQFSPSTFWSIDSKNFSQVRLSEQFLNFKAENTNTLSNYCEVKGSVLEIGKNV